MSNYENYLKTDFLHQKTNIRVLYLFCCCKVGVVITDGASSNQTATRLAADRAKDHNIQMMALGVGREVNVPELYDIASSEDDVFQVIDFKALDRVKEILALKICQCKCP